MRATPQEPFLAGSNSARFDPAKDFAKSGEQGKCSCHGCLDFMGLCVTVVDLSLILLVKRTHIFG